MCRNSDSRGRKTQFAVLLAALVGWQSSALVAADAPITDPAAFKAMVRKLSSLNIQMSDMRSTGEVTDTDLFKRFFGLALDGIRAPANDNLPKFRTQYFRTLLTQSGNAPSKAFHDDLNKFLIENLPPLVEDDTLKPAAHITATMILGDLNSKELSTGGKGAAVPLAAALPLLLNMYRTSKSEAVRATALAGMVRHAEAGSMTKDMQSQIVTEMLTTLATKDAPKGRSADAQLWFRRRACDILGFIGLPGDDADPAAVVTALSVAAVEGGDERLLPLRCDAASALARLKITPALNVNYARLAHTLALVAVDVARDETVGTQRGFRSLMLPLDNAMFGVLVTDKASTEGFKRLTPGGLATLAVGSPHETYVKSVVEQLQPLVDLSLATDFNAESAKKLADDLESWIGENPAEGEVVAAK